MAKASSQKQGTAAKSTPVQSNTQTAKNTVTAQQVAQRAFEIFLARGGQHGRDVEDWLQAERELSLGRQ